jgi:hypothetical protein
MLFFTSANFAQSNGQFGVCGGASYNYRLMLPDGGLVKDLPAFNYHFGLAYLQPISKNISLLGGIGFRTTGTNSEKKTDLRWGSELPVEFGGTGMIDPSLPREVQFFRQHRFLEVPVSLRFYAKTNQIWYGQIGLNNMAYLNSRTRTKTDLSTQTSVSRNNSIRNIHTALQLEMGWQWPLGNSPFMLSLAPNLQFHLSPLNKEGSSKEHPYSGGLAIGFWW